MLDHWDENRRKFILKTGNIVQMGSQVNSTNSFIEETILILYNLTQGVAEGTLSSSFYEASITPII